MRKLIQRAAVCLGAFVFIQPALAGGNAENGEKLVAVCSACHSNDGNSASPLFPKIAGLGEKYIYKQLKDIANKDPKKPSREIAEMTGMLDNLSDQNLQDIAAYFAAQPLTLSGAKNISVKLGSGVVLEAAETLALGEKIYRAGNADKNIAACTACHSPTGSGNGPAGYPRLGGQYAEYIEKQLKAFQAGDRTNDDAEVMRDVAANLSAAEIKAVSNYISGLQ